MILYSSEEFFVLKSDFIFQGQRQINTKKEKDTERKRDRERKRGRDKREKQRVREGEGEREGRKKYRTLIEILIDEQVYI